MRRRLRQGHLDARARRLEVAEIDEARLGRHPLTRERAAAGVTADVGVRALVVDARRGDPAVLVGEVARLRLRDRGLVPGVVLVDRVAERVLRHEGLLVLPAVEVGAAEQDPQHQVDLDEIRRHELAVDHDAGRDEALAAPLRHRPVVVVDVVGIVEGAPADEVRVAEADLLVARKGLVEEVVEVVVHRHRALDVLDVAHQPHVVVGHRLMRDVRAAAARHDRRGVRVAAAEEAVHLARVARHVQRLEVELAGERVERPHDVRDRAVAVDRRVLGERLLGLREHARVRLLDHLLAEVDVRHAVVEDRVVEHVVGGLGQVERVVAELRRLHAIGHVLVQAGAGRVVVTADAADAARDEVRVARVDALHEDVEAAEDHRRRVALEDFLVREVDLGVDAEAPDDAGDRIPGHLLDDDLALLRRSLGGRHVSSSLPSASSSCPWRSSSAGSRSRASPRGCASRAPCRTWCRCCDGGST